MKTIHRLWLVVTAGLLAWAAPGSAAGTAAAPVPQQDQLPAPVQVSPPDFAYVGSGPVTLAWTPVSGAASYRISVMQEGIDAPSWGYDSAVPQVTIDNLPSNTSFYWWVRALHPTNSYQHSNWSTDLWAFTTSSEVIVPLMPALMRASMGEFRDWVELAIYSSVRAERYHVYRTDLETQQTAEFDIFTSGKVYNDETVTPGRRYAYTVQACNSAGCSDVLEPPVEGWAGLCQETLPIPRLVSPEHDEEFVFEPDLVDYTLRWQEEPGIDAFQVEVYDQQSGALAAKGDSQGVVFYMQDEGFFKWRVRALDPVQGCPAGEWSGLWNYHAIMGKPPLTPVNLKASQGAYPDRIELTWDVPPSDTLPDEHVIFWSLSPVFDEGQAFTLWSGGEEASVEENLEPGKVYYFWVRACQHSRGCSEPSQRAAGWLRTSSQAVLQQILFLPRVGR